MNLPVPSRSTREELVRLYSRAQVQRRVRALAGAIRRDFRGRDLVVVGVLKGAFVFTADLVRALRRPVTVDFVGLSSYGHDAASSGRVTITTPLRVSVEDKDVLVVEDILDTGLSLSVLREHLRVKRPRSVRVCVLVDKRERRAEAVEADYVGFEVPGGFIVGYGIDYAERYRELPGIYRVDFMPAVLPEPPNPSRCARASSSHRASALYGRLPDATSPDVLLRNGRVLDVVTGEIERANVLLGRGTILAVGAIDSRGAEVYDVGGAVILPGFIDAHIHMESSYLTPPRFAEAVVPRGTTTVVADPHEIANVLGLDGVRFMLTASRALPLDCLFTAPPCVPASPFDSAGAVLGPAEVARMLDWPRVVGLAEVMDVRGLLANRPDLLDKIRLARARGLRIDGHAPGLTGPELGVYARAGMDSDHECVNAEEGRDRLHAGMRLMIREGSQARNLEALLPLVNPLTARRCLLVSDDCHALDLMEQGHVDHLLRRAVALGCPPHLAVQMITLNAAEYFGLAAVGHVAPGYRADLAVVEDLVNFRCRLVFKRGRLVAEAGKLLADCHESPPAPPSMRAVALVPDTLAIPARGGPVRVIGLVPGQIVTESLTMMPATARGRVIADPERDLAKLVVVERHRGTGRIGLGLVHGLGLSTGALASSFAHDSHNLIAAGMDDLDIVTALTRVIEHGGGLALAAGGRSLASVALPVAGLMNDQPLGDTEQALRTLEAEARRLGITAREAFSALSFLALPVIPALRLTDRGLVDVTAGRFAGLFAEE